jgi:hypothetical protein
METSYKAISLDASTTQLFAANSTTIVRQGCTDEQDKILSYMPSKRSWLEEQKPFLTGIQISLITLLSLSL